MFDMIMWSVGKMIETNQTWDPLPHECLTEKGSHNSGSTVDICAVEMA